MGRMPIPEKDDCVTLVVETGDPLTLKEAQDFVGGYIEIIVKGDVQIVVNEEGLLHRLPENTFASIFASQPLVGNVLVLAGPAKLP